jgi:hypothetical protein
MTEGDVGISLSPCSSARPSRTCHFMREGIDCHPFRELLSALSRRSDHKFSGSTGGDLAEIVTYYSDTIRTANA